MPRAKADWVATKAAYVEGFDKDGKRNAEPSLKDVCAKFGVPWGTLNKRATAEKWVDERALFRKRLEEARQEKKTDLLAGKGAEFDGKALRVAERLLAQVSAHLEKGEKDPLPHDELRSLAQAAQRAQGVGRLAMGESTENAKLYAELLQKPDLSGLSDAELEQLEAIMSKAQPAAGRTLQ